MHPREFLIECFRAALAAVDARRCVRENLRSRPLRGDWHVVAIGKAAGAMCAGAFDAMGETIADACVVVPPRHLPADFDTATGRRARVHTGAHPLPDTHSLEAGQAVIDFVTGQPPAAQLLFLVSGGASALVESLRPGITLDDLQSVNRWALGSGLSIADVNRCRRRMSRLKGGGLAALASPRRCVALMVSDVPGDDPRTLGSGLLHAPREDEAAAPLPAEFTGLLDLADATASGDLTSAARVPVRMVATLRDACMAAAGEARGLGWQAVHARRRFAGEAAVLAAGFADEARRLPSRTLMVRGGESTVSLPARAGRGGRNQHLALAAAMALERRKTADTWLLAAGTDGIDGASEDAGAIVDGQTCLRARDAGFDPHVSLAGADSGTLLEASGDLLHTGATLTNVGDLVLALRYSTDGEE